MPNECYAYIFATGLAIKNPNEPGLNLDFLYETSSDCHHKLKLSGKDVPNEEIEIPPHHSQINITTHLAVPVPPLGSSQLNRNILNLNSIHGNPLRSIKSQEVSLINLNILEAIPYSANLTSPHRVYWLDSGDIIGTFPFTKIIGAVFEIQPDGNVTIEGVPTGNGQSLVLPYQLGKQYELIFNNKCKSYLHNDFYLYYEVLESNNGRKINIVHPSYPTHIGAINPFESTKNTTSIKSEIIACNPVEGGGGS